MHMAIKVLKFNRDTEMGIEEKNVQGTNPTVFIATKPCQMSTVSI